MESVIYRTLSDSSDMSSETTPLLWSAPKTNTTKPPSRTDVHADFCALVGVPASNAPNTNRKWPRSSLYGRATNQLFHQTITYNFTASLNNTMLLSQVVLGAAVTALGASASSHLLITIIGALNTVIAGLVAYLKSRGQPMRARMYREDLERVVDEIENAEVMFLGISLGVSGYDDAVTEYDVTVRSEVARLTRLYDRAVENNTRNNPDTYVAAGADVMGAGIGRAKQPVVSQVPPQTQDSTAAAPSTVAAPVVAAAPVADSNPDSSPASAPPKKADELPVQAPAAASVVAAAPIGSNPDASPASAPPKKAEGSNPAQDKARVNSTVDLAGKGQPINGTTGDTTRSGNPNSSAKTHGDDFDHSTTQVGQQERKPGTEGEKRHEAITEVAWSPDNEPAIAEPSEASTSQP